MKSFKEYSKKSKDLPMLSWEGHESLRRPLNENWGNPIEYHDMTDDYDKEFHDHPDIKPQGLTNEHKKAIVGYASVPSKDPNDGHRSSRNVNGRLRHLAGDMASKVMHHTHEAVHEAIKSLSSAFTKENTNRVKIHTYSGIPKHIGDALEKSGHGSQHHVAGFTSTSSKKHVAKMFAAMYGKSTEKHHHVVEYHVEPHAGLSIAPHSRYQNENEVLLHHGARITYHGTKIEKSPRTGKTMHIHVVTVHADHKPLEEYGSKA